MLRYLVYRLLSAIPVLIVVSLVTFLLAVFFLITKGLHFSIEFTGGTVMEVSYDKHADVDRIRTTLEKAGVIARDQLDRAERGPIRAEVGRVAADLIDLPARQSRHIERAVQRLGAGEERAHH